MYCKHLCLSLQRKLQKIQETNNKISSVEGRKRNHSLIHNPLHYLNYYYLPIGIFFLMSKDSRDFFFFLKKIVQDSSNSYLTPKPLQFYEARFTERSLIFNEWLKLYSIYHKNT